MAYSQKHTEAVNGFYNYMCEVLALYKDMIPLLKAEFEAVDKDDTAALDASMNKQQAILLKTRLFDEKMAAYTKDIEVPASNLTDLVSNLPAEDSQRFAELQKEFRITIEEVLFYRNKCKDLLTAKLHHINTVLDKTGGPKENMTYNSQATEVQTSLFPKSFQKSI